MNKRESKLAAGRCSLTFLDVDQTRAESLESARTEAHEQMALSLRRELEANNLWG